jgi:hypothetical protein
MMQIIDSDRAECAWMVADYPYGFKLRTKIRYWIETKKEFGQREVSQTMNPKNGKWNEPKKSTYSSVIVMYEEEPGDENPGYIHFSHLTNYSPIEEIEKFEGRWMLDDFQKSQIKFMKASIHVSKHLEWKISEGGSNQTQKEQADIVKSAILYELQKGE